MADRKIELLSPAGDMERLEMALLYGADAVYLAGQEFGMRAASGNFDHDGIRDAVKKCRKRGAKVYVTCNAIPTNDEMTRLPQFLESLEEVAVDAVIAADMGVIALAGRYAPSVDLHISTQAGIMNYSAARAVYDMGAKRAVLARELSIEEIAEIRAKTPKELELEAFIHGAMCVSFSGRCLLSSFMTGRNANRGQCAQPCRWTYHLVESSRPNEYMEISEDGGTHILSARDLCMIEHIPEVIEAGLDSLKIEGRMKSAYYTAVVTNAYRKVIDQVVRGEEPSPIWLNEVEKVSHREYSTGFYFDRAGGGQNYCDDGYILNCDVMGVVISCEADGTAVVSQRNRFRTGDTLELLSPEGEPVEFVVGGMREDSGVEIDDAKHPMMRLTMKLPRYAVQNSLLRRDRNISAKREQIDYNGGGKD